MTVQNITTLMSGKYRCKMNESAIGGKSDKSMVTTEITIGSKFSKAMFDKLLCIKFLNRE